MEQKQQEAAEAAEAAEAELKMRKNLVGKVVVEAGKCDTCLDETSDCVKVALADGSHICLQDFGSMDVVSLKPSSRYDVGVDSCCKGADKID